MSDSFDSARHRSNRVDTRASAVLFLPLFLAAGLLATSCARPPIKIGFVGPLTGPSSAVGLGCRNGFSMAFGPGHSAAAGATPKFELLIKDDRNDPESCLEALKALKSAGCSLVVLGTTSQAAKLAIPWAISNAILVISPTVSNSEFSGRDDLFIRVNASSGAYGAQIAHAAFVRFGKRRVAFTGDSRNGLYVEAVWKDFESEYARLGGTVPFSTRFDSALGSPSSGLAEALLKQRCDGLFAVTASTEAVLIAKALEKAGTGVRLFLPPWSLTRDLLQNGGLAVEGAVASSIADLEYGSAEGKAFESAYRADYGESPSFTAMFGYEASLVLRRAIAETRSSDPVAIKDAIVRIRDFKGIQGSIAFDRNGDATRALFLFTIERGAFKRLD